MRIECRESRKKKEIKQQSGMFNLINNYVLVAHFWLEHLDASRAFGFVQQMECDHFVGVEHRRPSDLHALGLRC